MRKLILSISIVLISALALPAAPKVETRNFQLKPGERCELSENYVRTNNILEVVVDSKKFQPFSFGQGEKNFMAAWIELTEKEIVVIDVKLRDKRIVDGYNPQGKTVRAATPVEVERIPHNLNLKKGGKIRARLEVGIGKGELTISSGRKSFSKELDWNGGGAPFVKNNGTKPFSAELSFTRKNIEEPLWFYSASYFNPAAKNRWPYYMVQEGYAHWFADHQSGGSSQQMLRALKNDLKFGTPKVIVWMLMANNKSDKDVVDPVWMGAVNELVEICKEKNIELVLTIYPQLKGRDHSKKSEWIRNSGYRVIDWYSTISPEGQWLDPAWSGRDGVHPTAAGAKELWKEVKRELHELR